MTHTASRPIPRFTGPASGASELQLRRVGSGGRAGGGTGATWHTETTPSMGTGAAEEGRGCNIFQAVKDGDVKKCQQIIEAEGPEVLGHYDEKGHTPAHWAALAGSVEIMEMFVDCKGPVDLQSQAELGQRPIHWAAVNGHIAVVDFLLKAGVSVDVDDQKGCTPLITAAQYGQTALVCYLIGKGARVYLCDSEGDTALHWAAFKGHCELAHLLIHSGCNTRQSDNYGQTPLHLAVLSGSLSTVQLLCEQDGAEFEGEDNNKNTPLKLATGRKFNHIVSFLNSVIAQSKNLNARFDWRTWVFGRPGKSKGPILFFYGNLFLWGYPTYYFKIVPVSYYALWELHIMFLLSNALMWILFLKASLMDPGFLPQDTEEYRHAVKQAINFNDWKNGKNPLNGLCHTCHLVKPLRSKHCRITNRCVSHFDHYCPYVYNDVGLRNRAYFVGFLFSMCVCCVIGMYLCYDWFQAEGRSFLIGAGFLFLTIIAIVSALMTVTCLYMAAVNLTTNERLNLHKYAYLKDGAGKFKNPFSRGLFLNLLEFVYIIPPLKDQHIKRKEQQFDI
ncbi:uncharacterized protein O3C94_005466 [Discoglossus pictus]